ncbi:unnamed protein product [Triticum turgidum subsp. durum]|uniref:Protein kinase domain-containing protein n=1 Tax=Triticum turgidum subsp. durum TaxID=4567 RepID=A0A9R0QMU2_TRITD|nr:unnamed protein product [Triticum turgidum subsp. durum]
MDGDGFEEAELDALEHVVRDTSAEPMKLSLPLVKHITNDFSGESLIGEGGFSKVYLGVLPSGSRIAVKRILSSHTMDERPFRREIDTTRKAAHKNIVRLIGYCSHTEETPIKCEGQRGYIYAEMRERLICIEYVPNGTLDTHITDESAMDVR